MDAIQFPRDLESRPEFRKALASGAYSDGAMLVFFIWRLFRELHYAADEGKTRLGVLPDWSAQNLARETTADLDKLNGSILERDPEGQGWLCPMFAVLHRSLSRGGDTMQHKGQRVKQVNDALTRADRTHAQELLLFDANKLRKPDGGFMSPEEQRRVFVLLHGTVSALGGAARKPSEFGAGMIADAWLVLDTMPMEAITASLHHVAKNRLHPFFSGMTPEKLLATDDATKQPLLRIVMKKVD
jgi:hypothetical protein